MVISCFHSQPILTHTRWGRGLTRKSQKFFVTKPVKHFGDVCYFLQPLLLTNGSLSPQLNSDCVADDMIPEQDLLQSQDSASSNTTEDVLQIRDETPSLEACLDNASSQLPEVGRDGAGAWPI